MRLEQDTIGAVMNNPKDLLKTHLEESWFFDKSNKEVAQTLIETKGNVVDPSGLFEEVKKRFPYTNVSVESLQVAYFDGMDMNLEEKAGQLKRRYYKWQFDEATRNYTEYPNEENLLKMKDAMRELDELDKPEDDGSLNETVEGLLEELEVGIDPGIRSYPMLDNILGGGLSGGMLVIIGARPGKGKTAYGLNIAMEAMEKQKGLMVDFFTLEMSKMQMLKRFISRMVEINSMKMRNPKLALKEEEKAAVVASGLEIMQSELRIHDRLFRLKEIERQIRRRHYEAQGKPYIAFVDYLGLVDVEDKRQPRHVQVGEITRTMKILTNELNIPIVLFSQLNRGIESRQDKKPTLADLRESGSIEQDANVVMFLHQDEEDDGRTIVSVAKNREGFTGDIPYRFYKSKMYFEELEE